MVSIWEIAEALRRFGRMSTRDLRVEFNTDNDIIWQACRLLQGLGYVKRAGKDKNRIIWELTPKALALVKDKESLYDIPFIQGKERIYLEKSGKLFKRWD